jgi:F0F1-type ATP synthase alpha subunit
MELLKQKQYEPYSLEHQVMLIFASSRGFLDGVTVEKVDQWRTDFLRFMDTAHSDVGQAIRDTYDFTEETEASLRQALEDFNASWSA